MSGRVAAWIFALAPAALFLLTWTEEFTPLQQMARAFALPVVTTQLVIVAVSFAGGWRLGRSRTLPIVLTLALGALAWTTAVTAEDQVHSLFRTGIWTIQLAFALAIVNLWKRQMLDTEQVWRAILWGFLLFFAFLIAFVASVDQTPHQRLWGLPAFGHIRWFGYYAAGVVGLAAAGFLRGDRLALFAATMAFALASWTGTRGTLAATLAGFSACTIMFGEFRSIRGWVRLLSCAVAGLLAALALNSLVPLGQGLGKLARFGLSGRIEIWIKTLEHFRLRPWFGWGEGQVPGVFRGEPVIFGQPHNVVIQVLHAWGVAGVLLCLSLAAWVASRFLKAREEQAAPFRCGALILAAYSFVDGTLYYTQPLSLFVLCCAVAVAIGQNGTAELRPAPSD
jgi:hypothetical protein